MLYKVAIMVSDSPSDKWICRSWTQAESCLAIAIFKQVLQVLVLFTSKVGMVSHAHIH